MKILISNDDGYRAPGLARLVEGLRELAELTVVVPDRDRSGASNSLTLENPIRAQVLDNGFIRVNGTPTDCVHLAITGLLEQEPDMVISGINAGANLGDDVIYSGTVAAAMEGRFLGLPAVAVSLVGRSLEHYATAAEAARRIVTRLQSDPLPPDVILNVNVPDLPWEYLAGFMVTRLGHRHKSEPVIMAADPRGHLIARLLMARALFSANTGALSQRTEPSVFKPCKRPSCAPTTISSSPSLSRSATSAAVGAALSVYFHS